MNTFKCFLLLLAGIMMQTVLAAQEPARKSGAVKAAESVNKKSRELTEASNQVLNESQQVAANIQQAVSNVKAVVKVFEPILRFRLKKKEPEVNQPGGSAELAYTAAPDTVPVQPEADAVPPGQPDQAVQVQPQQYIQTGVTQEELLQGVPVIPESALYNSDGSANLGSQNHKTFGCYLDMTRGAVMDEIDAAGNARAVDLIFTATGAFNEQVPMYAFLTPAYARHDAFAYNFFKGVKYKDKNIPPMSWEEVNESEVAMTSLTPAQFEKIKDNNQLMAVLKQVRGYGPKVESRAKLEGKVIAVKTEMGDRTAYGLICILRHFGTTGENGYLTVKIKVTGFDSNGDGIPDQVNY